VNLTKLGNLVKWGVGFKQEKPFQVSYRLNFLH